MQWNEDIFSAFQLEYALPVLFAMLVAAFWPASKHYNDPRDRRKYRILQLVTLTGAVVGSKIVALMGNTFWPVMPVTSWGEVMGAGRSILGGLLGGFAAAEIAKPLFGYKLPPNNRFAATLAFSLAIGRIGCFLAGCCRGLPQETWLAVTYGDGIARYPTPLYEMLFHVSVGIAFVAVNKRRLMEGRLFSLYLIAYALFRFFTEFMRATPKLDMGLSVYQLLSMVMFLVGTASYFWQLNRGTPAVQTPSASMIAS